ncbi:MAG: hypothetical protein LBT40_14370 [Deltaproteobacteria bacterium]|jgi:uncharacterized protein YcfJ|nr:hypothetical protein [Deltaproteobacteria bacterium]
MRTEENRTRRALPALCVALALTMLFTGCAGGRLGRQTVRVNYYPECYQPVTDMRENAKQLNENVMKGAIGGAIAGGLAALLTGSGDWREVAVSAAAGAITGATVSYLITSETQSRTQEERFAIYSQTMDVDYRNLDQAVAAARMTATCYKREYQQVARDYKAGRMSQEEMVERVTEIRDGTSDAATILRNYNDVAAANIQTYEEVVRMENTRPDRGPRSSVASVRNKANSMQRAKTQAETVLAELDDTRSQSDLMLQSLQVNRHWIILAAMPDTPIEDCGPCGRAKS